MGHLAPFLRLVASLVHNHCRVTLIIPIPTVSLAESEQLSLFLFAFPQVNQIQFNLLPVDASTANSADPFFLRAETIRRSAHLLTPLLSSISPPLSAFIYDVFLISSVIPVTESLCLPGYILFTSSARMFSLYFSFHTLVPSKASDVLEIPGISSIPISSVPPPFLVPNNIFGNIVREDGPRISKLHGILINTVEGLEAKTLEALNSGKVITGLPPVFPVGPLIPCQFEKDGEGTETMKWLDGQPSESVVYVSFGNRTSMKRIQIKELGDGLVRSGCRFLWVLKDKAIDRDEEEGLDEVVGHELMERMKHKGLVVKTWVGQGEILGHRAVGGFVSHCGWNSVIETVWSGVRLLAWPQHGDQKINAEILEKHGAGMWVKSWGWGTQELVNGEEIGKGIKEMMMNESMRVRAAELKEVVKKAAGTDGCCEVTFKRLIEQWK